MLKEKIKGQPGIYNVLHNENMTVFYRVLEVLNNANISCGLQIVAVGRYFNEVYV